jgi:hypothetical protein
LQLLLFLGERYPQKVLGTFWGQCTGGVAVMLRVEPCGKRRCLNKEKGDLNRRDRQGPSTFFTCGTGRPAPSGQLCTVASSPPTGCSKTLGSTFHDKDGNFVFEDEIAARYLGSQGQPEGLVPVMGYRFKCCFQHSSSIRTYVNLA